MDVTSSSTVSVQRLYASSTSVARSIGHSIMPAYTDVISNSENSIAVTTPKLPPPPRSAQNRSGWLSASARTSVPSAVTISMATTLFAAMPWRRASQLRPPPSV